ncbi:MAG: hypothetical protein WCV85_04980 [Patescibacteria group bacterium]
MEGTHLARSARIASVITLVLWLMAFCGVMGSWYPEWNWRAQVFSTLAVLPSIIFAMFTLLPLRSGMGKTRKIFSIACFVNIPLTVCVLILPLFMVLPLHKDNLLLLQNGTAHVVHDVEFLWTPSTEGTHYTAKTAAAEEVQIFATFTPEPEMLLLVHELYGTPENYYAACRNEFSRRLRLAKTSASDSTARECVQCAFVNTSWNTDDTAVKYSHIQVAFEKQRRF